MSATEEKTVRAVSVAQLRDLVSDPSELKKGTEIADRGGLAHLSRYANKLFADAAGSGAAPYKTQIVFGDDKVTGRCSCMAARSRPYCKHAAALLVSWARTPEAFVTAEAPAALDGEKAKRSSVKKGKVDQKELQKKGIAQAATLLGELWQTGVHALAADRADQVTELAASLRELGLRRLSGKTLELGKLLGLSARRDNSFSEDDYASLVSDMWLTVRKLEKYLDGEALQNEHVEELIGKTWTKKDRPPIAELDLVEYAFWARTTADGFVLRESRLLDLRTGAHFAEKQILPAMIAKRTPPKPSYVGQVLRSVTGTVFPSFAPRRIDIEDKASAERLGADALARLVEQSLPSVSAALAQLAERRRDVFAPPWVPVAMRIEWVVPASGRVRLLDGEGNVVFLAGGQAQEDALMTALNHTEAQVVIGDLALEGAMPTLFALAVVGRQDGALRLLPLGGEDASEAAESRDATHGWLATAKRAGVSNAAILLGEVRDDLATRFAAGTSAISASALEPLATRLAQLSLAKQADALRAVGTATDATERLDGLVKLHQVLGIALTRLVSAVKVERDRLVRLPTMPAVAVTRPETLLAPAAAVAAEARGELHRYERLYHVGAYYEALAPEVVLGSVDALWGDGSAAQFVVRAAEKHRALAVDHAKTVLAEGEGNTYRRCSSRIAKLTALAILDKAGRDSVPFLEDRLRQKLDPTLASHIRRALRGPSLGTADLQKHTTALVAAGSKDDRVIAIDALTAAAATEAIPALRAALRDRSRDVRKAAAYGLAALGDVDSLDVFVSWLDGGDHDAAKVGAHALGLLGDVRATGALLAALGRGFSPAIVREALELLGPWVLGPLLDLALAQPELAKRAAVASLVGSFPEESTAGTLIRWIAAGADDAAVRTRAGVALDACKGQEPLKAELGRWLQRERPALLAGDDKETRALRRRLEPPKPKAAKPTT